MGRNHQDVFIGLFSEWIEAHQPPDKELFFVQGIWGSDTGRLARMLNAHPDLYVCQHDLQAFTRLVECKIFGQDMDQHPFIKERMDVGRKIGFLAMLKHLQQQEAPHAKLIGEHSPGGDVCVINESFPNAKLVIMMRDGRDLCVSTIYHDQKQTYESRCFEDTVHGRKFRESYLVHMAELYAGFMNDYDTLKRQHPQNVYLLRYEDFSQNTVVELDGIFRFLEIEPVEATLSKISAAHASDNIKGRTADENMTQPAFLTDSDLCLFEDIAGEALLSAGYQLTAR